MNCGFCGVQSAGAKSAGAAAADAATSSLGQWLARHFGLVCALAVQNGS
ncbi:hypothetical protein [Comamonas avium]|uniref:Uncharacterized protein n=1 Tax=Comamonas avium TaxID=2762231 RepID=A0ABR8S6B8_9BURK|nr:hypothetical protein [Comamonas avium]MBD7959023.1 hypothetical protein [Comamonas avium]